MSDLHEKPWLIALAADVCEGRPVDWDHVQEQSIDAETDTVLRGLKRLARVVDAHRNETEPEEPESQLSALQPSHHPKLWRHLIVLEVVGTGAFGTVYRAWDPQLEREVALKLRVASGGRAPWTEAQHLARIHHPNVVTVYGAEQDDRELGIWMEFIEGQTLAAIVQERGPMSAREVAGIGIDVCRALSALHSAGLLHRDIKAQNVMREVGGRIVLMDFSGTGARETSESSAVLSGTPLYMAPELFDGRPATPATDTYSLGVLLFYLFSGRLPVEGSSLADVRQAHAHGSRVRLRDLRPELPDTVVQIVEHATEIDPSARYQSAGDLEHALAGVLGPHVTLGSTPQSVAGSARTPSRGLMWMGVAATLAMGLVAGGLLFASRKAPTAPPLPVQFTIGPPLNVGSWPRVSPDGRFVVFGTFLEGRSMLWVRALDADQGKPLLNTTATETPFWSPDARQLAFLANGKLKTVDVESGRTETLADVAHMAGGDWNSAGVLIFGTDAGIDRIARDGSDRRHVVMMDTAHGDYRLGWPEFLPDGKRFLYINRNKTDERTGVYLASLDSDVRKRIMPAYSRVVYSPSGHLLFVRNGTLMAQAFDVRSADLLGEPVSLAGPIKYHSSDDGAFDISANGVLIYRLNEGLPTTKLIVFDRRGRELASVAPAGLFGEPRFSPDGERVAVERFSPDNGAPDIWVFDAVRNSAAQLTRTTAPDVHPIWSTDGRSVIFSSKRSGYFDLYRTTFDPGQSEELLWHSDENKRAEDWSRDGRLLAVSVPRKGLWTVELGSMKRTLIRTTTSSDNGMQAEFSPDARLIAYASGDAGRPEVYVEPLPSTGVRWRLSTEGGAEPHWRGDGRELLYLSIDGWMMSVAIPAGRWNPGPPRRLFRVVVPSLLGGSNFSISRDADRILVNSVVEDATVPPIHVLINQPLFLTR